MGAIWLVLIAVVAIVAIAIGLAPLVAVPIALVIAAVVAFWGAAGRAQKHARTGGEAASSGVPSTGEATSESVVDPAEQGVER
jgi:hypothetical protein